MPCSFDPISETETLCHLSNLEYDRQKISCMAERVQVRLYQIWFKMKKRKEILNLEKAVYSMAYILREKKKKKKRELSTNTQASMRFMAYNLIILPS